MPGVVAFSETLRGCEAELQSVLEVWILLGLKLGRDLPVMEGMDLNANRPLPPLKPCKRRDFIRRLRKLGFDGPYSGTRHQFMVRGQHRQTIPSNAEYSVAQLTANRRGIDPLRFALSAISGQLSARIKR